MNKIEHIGIAVKNLADSQLLFEKLLGVGPYKSEEVASESVVTAFFKTDNTKIELLSATKPESAIAQFIEKKGEGLHHIAFEVADLETEIARLKNEDFVFVDEIPKNGADNKRIVFLHPKNTHGVLIELCQEIK
ncbi:methylmalonyl-CoA epimerase [Flavobacterium sp. UMI-01]|uniref:methylmalonyl-CoA epimerase n=1 Tax=Flavobacterium sp. UMI-01 TaxID=1441053 RepID=UPI001C7CFBF0|nr:methylmalonyl-CoA epimerase [Flavobacterium sp. UMI-01]GIZ09264.1 methylmalonyl-CoA epimerase [Flavobacterium sp. UMI-01]